MAKLTGPYPSQNNATAISSHFIFVSSPVDGNARLITPYTSPRCHQFLHLDNSIVKIPDTLDKLSSLLPVCIFYTSWYFPPFCQRSTRTSERINKRGVYNICTVFVR